MGTYQMMLGLGPAIGPLLGGWIGGKGGHSAVFLFLAITAVLLLVSNAVLLPETKRGQVTANRFSWRSFRDVVTQPVGLSVILIGFTQMFTYYCFLLFLPAHLGSMYNLSAQQIGLVYTMVLGVFMVSGKLTGRLQKAVGTRAALLLAVGANALSTLLFMAVADVSLILFILASAAFGSTLGMGMPLHTELLSEAFENERATAIGVYNFVRYTGMAAGPVAGAWLFALGGAWMEFGMAGLVMAIAYLIARKQLRKHKQADIPAA